MNLKFNENARNKYTTEELGEALNVISSIISNCEKIQVKFEQGTSQHTLLENRIKAMYLSKALITGEKTIDQYKKEEVSQALKPVVSIINKCEKAQLKFEEGTSHHKRFKKMIKAMYLSKALITDEISKRG